MWNVFTRYKKQVPAEKLVRPFTSPFADVLTDKGTESAGPPSYQDILQLNSQLYEMLQHDHLTGLYNMRSIYDKIDFELKRRHHKGLACIMIDLDNFKHINDQYGHLFGSYVLQQFGHLLKQNTRQTDLAARYGGDEFLIVLTDTPTTGVQSFCQRLQQNLKNKIFSQQGHTATLTASLGYAISYPLSTLNPTAKSNEIKQAMERAQIEAPKTTCARTLVQQADKALYQAKAQGRNRVQAYS